MKSAYPDLQIAKTIQNDWLKSRFKLTHVFEHHRLVTLVERFMEPMQNLREYMAWRYKQNLPIYTSDHDNDYDGCYDIGLNTFFKNYTQDFHHYSIIRTRERTGEAACRVAVNARTLEPNLVYTKAVDTILKDLKHTYGNFQQFHSTTYHYKLFEHHRCIRVDHQIPYETENFSMPAYTWQKTHWRPVAAYVTGRIHNVATERAGALYARTGSTGVS